MSRQGQKLGRKMCPVFPFRPFRGETRRRETFRRRGRSQRFPTLVLERGFCDAWKRRLLRAGSPKIK